jgi:hypothetical protein
LGPAEKLRIAQTPALHCSDACQLIDVQPVNRCAID